MYIKSIVLDGFKSYGQRTEILDFDNLFNAITGLNGSGKSNILDAICFLLGITNLAHVRAANLQELVFKSGQAGINKATVSITFDNRNKAQCPPGLENYDEITISRQVIIGGKNKYLLNGINVTTKKIQDLFCSVQLNVNNPNFLIMQGQVTKVLNMKSEEILAMVEESAGTRMYEIKKQQCQRTIDRKNARLAEFREVSERDVLPNLEKLRRERSQYLEYQRIERELAHMTGLFKMWCYWKSKRDLENAAKALAEFKQVLQSIKDKMEHNKALIEEKKQQKEQLIKNQKSDVSVKLHALIAQKKEKEKVEVKMNANVKAIENNINSEERNVKQLEKSIADDEKKIKAKKDELAKVQNMFETLKENEEKDNAAFDLAQKKFVAFSAGMEINDDGESETLQEQLMKANSEALEAETAFKQAAQEVAYCEGTLKEKQKEVLNTSEYNKYKGNQQKLEIEVEKLQNKLNSIKYSEEKWKSLNDSKRTLEREIHALQQRIEHFEMQKPFTKFSYQDPEPNFNRNRIFGPVCRLIQIKDRNVATALETAAGRRLYDVVVDSDVTGKVLLNKGNLQQRTTFIPLNKVQSHKMDNRIIEQAENLVGKENCRPALSLISFDSKLQPAMDFIFGNVFICKDTNVAKKVTYNDKIRRKCVTLDGDVCDPGGTLSGGARQKGEPVLTQMQEIIKLEDELKLKKAQLQKIESELRNLVVAQDEYNAVTQSLNKKSHELNVIKQNVQHTSYHQLQKEVQELKARIVDLKTRMNECKQKSVECSRKSKELEHKIKTGKGNRENVLKEAEAEMKRIQKKAEISKQAWIDQKQNYEMMQLEIKELEKELEDSKQEITKIEGVINKLKEEHESAKQETNSVLEEIKGIDGEIEEAKTEIASQMKEVNQLEEECVKITEANFELQVQLREHEHGMKSVEDKFKLATFKERDATKLVKDKDANSYLEKAKSLSDKEGFELERNIQSYQEKKTKLGRTVNAKAQSMFQQEDKLFNDLNKRSKKLEVDLKKMHQVMKDLDQKKKVSLQLAYQQISEGFGSIFSTLLPGANAKLVAPFGKTFLEGLEIKVSLGGIWKESLTELSGGQRSLAALSLILSMLSFKPAPIYILDEVDAALDLSHTQNIGIMLREHFKKSQFIIVSLKDGMFSNANVLFRTKFVDGVSAVTRTVNKS